MPDLNAVVKHVSDYRASRISLAVFEDRFRDDFRGAYLVPQLDELQASIESALSDYRFGEDRDEALLRQELANAIRPFVPYVVSGMRVIPGVQDRVQAMPSFETYRMPSKSAASNSSAITPACVRIDPAA